MRVPAQFRLHGIQRAPAGQSFPGLGMEIAGTMIALNHRQCAAGQKNPLQPLQSPGGVGKVLQHKAEEDMVETIFLERQLKDIRPLELNIRNAFVLHQTLCLIYRTPGNIHGDDSCLRALFRQDDRLGTYTASRLQDSCAGRVGCVMMKKACKRPGLI